MTLPEEFVNENSTRWWQWWSKTGITWGRKAQMKFSFRETIKRIFLEQGPQFRVLTPDGDCSGSWFVQNPQKCAKTQIWMLFRQESFLESLLLGIGVVNCCVKPCQISRFYLQRWQKWVLKCRFLSCFLRVFVKTMTNLEPPWHQQLWGTDVPLWHSHHTGLMWL